MVLIRNIRRRARIGVRTFRIVRRGTDRRPRQTHRYMRSAVRQNSATRAHAHAKRNGGHVGLACGVNVWSRFSKRGRAVVLVADTRSRRVGDLRCSDRNACRQNKITSEPASWEPGQLRAQRRKRSPRCAKRRSSWRLQGGQSPRSPCGAALMAVALGRCAAACVTTVDRAVVGTRCAEVATGLTRITKKDDAVRVW